MARKRPKHQPGIVDPQAPEQPPAEAVEGSQAPRSRQQSWVSRVLVAVIVPLLLFGAVELGLRLLGVGYPTGFFVKVAGRDAFTSNQCFGWRFFPKQVARNPAPVLISPHKPEGTIRIFVLGGSAALGTPDSAYSSARILQVLLEEAYPEQRFEVVNAAMTAINSHVVLEIARDCRRLQPDLLIVYLGNNEVVGPYGPGTVFGPLSRSRSLTRLGIRIRTTRIGQLLQEMLGGLDTRERRLGAWKGMEMFVGRQVRAGDPQLAIVYEHLRRNLEDIIGLATGGGARVVLSTVATNLADCPPFASLHRPDLGEAQLQEWQRSFSEAEQRLAAVNPEQALEAFHAALEIDDGYAELHFRTAIVLRQLGRNEDALQHFLAARDLDALRFRADSTINQIIRETAARREGVSLVDAEQLLASEARDGILGDELLYEHVHLRFNGSYRLAVAWAEEVMTELADRLGRQPAGPWMDSEGCALQLGLSDWDRHRMLAEIVAMTNRPPFTAQLDHVSRLRRRRFELRQLRHASRSRMVDAERRHRQAVQRRPDDLLLRVRLAELLQSREDFAGAAREWRTLLDRVPDNPVWHTNLGFALLDQGSISQAVAELRAALALRPELADLHVNLALALERQGQPEDAEKQLRSSLRINPASEMARLNLASLLARQDRYAESEALYREVLRDAPGSAEACFGLGALYERQQRAELAVDSYRRAFGLDPDMAKAGNNLGHLLQQLGRTDEALQVYRRTTELSPQYALAHFNLADLLLSRGQAAEAIPSYRQGLDERPGNHSARINLAVALQLVGRSREAAEQYREVISRQPDHPRAHIGYAWLLATTDDPTLRNLDEALRLGERALQLSRSEDPTILESMAVIYGTAGQPDKAAATRARARQLGSK